MPALLAAASDPSIGRSTIALVALVFLAGYVLACIVWPFAACRWCEGGKKRFPQRPGLAALRTLRRHRHPGQARPAALVRVRRPTRPRPALDGLKSPDPLGEVAAG